MIASVHRLAYFSEVVRYATDYYCLCKKKARKGLKTALAETYLDVKLNRINLADINLHEHTLDIAMEQFHILKKLEQDETKRMKCEKEEMLRFLIGDDLPHFHNK